MSRVPFATIDISARFDHRATDDIANLHGSRRNTWRSWQFAMVLRGDNRTCQPRWNLSSWSDVFSERCGNKCKGITLLRRPGSCGWSRRKSQKRWPTLAAERDLEIRDKNDRSLQEVTDIFMRYSCTTGKIYVQEVSVENRNIYAVYADIFRGRATYVFMIRNSAIWIVTFL